MREDNNAIILKKHSAIINAGTSTLSLRQLKIYDALMYSARGDLMIVDEKQYKFDITSAKLRRLLGLTGNAVRFSDIKADLKKLKSTEIEYDVKNTDQSGQWVNSSLILEQSVNYDSSQNVSNISFTLPDIVRASLTVPEFYANIDLNISKKFRSKHAKILYEVLLDSAKSTTFKVSDLRKMHGCEGKSYDNFASFKRRCLTLPIAEINESKVMFITFEEKKEGRKVVKIKFTTAPSLSISEFSIEELKELLKKFNFSAKEIQDLRDCYSEMEILKNLKYTDKMPKVKDKKAYAINAIKNSYAQAQEEKIIEHQAQDKVTKSEGAKLDADKKLKAKLTKDYSVAQEKLAAGVWGSLSPEQQGEYEQRFPSQDSDLFGDTYFFKTHIAEIFQDFYSELGGDLPKTVDEFLKEKTALYVWNEDKSKYSRRTSK